MRRMATLLLILFTVSASAQVSGYLGKRFLITGSAAGMLDVGRTLGIDQDNGLFNWQAEGNLQFVRSSTKAIGLHYRFQKSQHDYRSEEVIDFFGVGGTQFDPGSFKYALRPFNEGLATTTMHHMGFGWVFYSKGYVAPAGAYTEAEVGATYFSTQFDVGSSRVAVPDPSTGIAPYFSINRMKNHIVLDALVMTYGFSVTINPLGIYSATTLNSFQNIDYFADPNLLYHHGIERVAETGFFMFRLGFGLLPF